MLRLFAFALLVSVGATSALGQTYSPCAKDNTIKQDGECWRSLSGGRKSAAIMGMWAGKDAYHAALSMSGDTPPSFFIFRKDWIGAPEHTTIGDYIEYFDLLYKTPANRSVRWEWAYVLAAMKARDDDSDGHCVLD